MTMLDKYLPGYNDKIPSLLIDAIDSDWSTFSGDKRDLGFSGLMSTDSTCIAYHMLLESDIANNSSIPLLVRLALFNGLSDMVTNRKNRIVRGGKFGLFANVSKGKLIRTSDCKLDVKIGLYRVTDLLVRIDIYIFKQSKRHQDTMMTDERYQLSKTLVFSHSGELIKVTEVN